MSPAVLREILYAVGAMAFIAGNIGFLTWSERKVAGHIQRRLGPREVGPFGLLQFFADGIKLIGKEMITPCGVERPLYILAPTLVIVPVLVSFVVIPFDLHLQVRDMNMGIVVILAFSSLNVLGILIAGWSSNNKFSLIGALRSVAQNISYEIPLLLALLPVIMLAGSFSLRDIVAAQKGYPYILVQPLAFLLYCVAALAETNRTPFDLPEAESELVAGFHTEYSGMRFALFFLAEYTNIFIVSAVATTFFLGGWHGPLLPGVVWFFLKTYALVLIVLWARWTFPRVRFDQLLNFSWKVMMPLAFVNLLITAAVLSFGSPR